jgi:hypothetical protein
MLPQHQADSSIFSGESKITPTFARFWPKIPGFGAFGAFGANSAYCGRNYPVIANNRRLAIHRLDSANSVIT